MLPFVTALCPTFRHPELLANSVALWLAQDYPADRRQLLILDDGQTFDRQWDTMWSLYSLHQRMPTISAKYNELLQLASQQPIATDIFLVWEDDDLYMPGYVSQHVRTQSTGRQFSKPSKVLSDYTGSYEQIKLKEEQAAGRFHSSLGFSADLIKRVGGWPDTKRADFDQQLILNLRNHAGGIADSYDGTHRFVYVWHTKAAHCQSTMNRGPDDETWYDRGEQAYKLVPFVGQLVPKLLPRYTEMMVHAGANFGISARGLETAV